MYKKLLLTTLLVSVVASCTMAPEYKRPDAPIPNVYSDGVANTESELYSWKKFFLDETMQKVISTALENNRDLRISMLNIEKTRAQYRIQRADLLPTIGATAGSLAQKMPADVSPTGARTTTHQYSAGLGFSAYELDLFGRVRSLSNQALETYYSVEEDANSARLSLVAETAAVYLQLVADREQYDLTKATLENRKENYNLVKRRFNSGVASDLELSQAKMVVDEAEGSLASAATIIGRDENYLALLMGTSIPKDLPEIRKIANVKPLADVPAGLPSSLLERRPDIQASEHRLKAAYANIGAARANFFPSISLTGSFGTMSSSLNNLFAGGSGTWMFAPQVNLPIFDTGRNIAFLKVSEAERDIAIADYEKTIQTSFREVADALVERENISELFRAHKALVKSSQNSYKHASLRYETGVAEYINVLDAQRSLFVAESTLISTRLLSQTNALSLYKALGGGAD